MPLVHEKAFEFNSSQFNFIMKPKDDEYLYLVYNHSISILDYKMFN